MTEKKIPVPPVEDAWKKMKEVLDKQLPLQPDVTVRPNITRYLSIGKGLAVLSAIVSITLWLSLHHSTNPKPARSTGSSISPSVSRPDTSATLPFKDSIVPGPDHAVDKPIGRSDSQTSGSRSFDTRPSESRPSDNRTSQSQTSDNRPSDNRPFSDQPSHTRPSGSPSFAGANQSNIRHHNHPAAAGFDLTNKAFTHTINHRSALSSAHRPGDSGDRASSGNLISHTQQREHLDHNDMLPATSGSASHLHAALHPAPTRSSIGLSHRRLADSLLKKLAYKTEKPAPKQTKPKLHSPNVLTAGLQLSMALPVNDQQSSAKSSLFSDHIPAPYFRWYGGRRFYLEASLQINQPQYVRSQVLDSTSDSIHTAPYQGYLEVNRYTLKKLYYSNIPITIHYRLLNDLYIGTGIQYSLRWGGVAADEKLIRPSNGLGVDSAVSNTTTGLKGTSAWSKVRSTDLRLLFGISYYWRKFTLNAQYQRGLTPYLQDFSGHDHSASFRIGLQYDIWETKRK